MFYGILAGIFIIILASFIRHIKIRKKHPPGPLGLPFVGLLPFQIIQNFFPNIWPKTPDIQYFRLMKGKYGDIWSLEIGSQLIIVLASIDIMSEAFLDNWKVFSGRPTHESYKIVSEDLGILFVDGELWQRNRQLAIKALRDLGMGKRHLENQICNEVDELIEHISNNLLIPLKSPNTFVKAVSNVISRLAFNERNKYDDPLFEEYISNLKELAHLETAQGTIDLFPKFCQSKLARKIFPTVDHYLHCNSGVIRFISDKCRSRMNIEGQYSKPNCVFDYFWRYRYEDNPDIGYNEKFMSISHSLLDLFNAGTDTTTNMIAFSCLMLGQDRDFQKVLRTEIKSLIDDHTLINMDMRKDCPKLLSFIDEIQRYCYLVPKFHHRVTETYTFRGYELSPNDIIFGDIATIFRDPILFPNPDIFDPYRFMDDSKIKYIPNKSLIPFGIGKRSCLGEGIAVMELFLFLSKIIYKFDISLPKEISCNIKDILDGNCSFIHAPLDHEIIFKLTL